MCTLNGWTESSFELSSISQHVSIVECEDDLTTPPDMARWIRNQLEGISHWFKLFGIVLRFTSIKAPTSSIKRSRP